MMVSPLRAMAMMRSWASDEAFGDLHVQDGGVVVQAEHHQLEFPAGEVHRVRGGRMLEEVDDLVAGDFLRIEEHI